MATNSFGLFSAPTPLCVGEPFDKPKKKHVKGEESVTLRSFVTSPQKKGQVCSNWGDGPMIYNRLYDGEVHVEENKTRRRAKIAAKAKHVSERPFKPGNPTKKQASSGDYYGTFCPQPYESKGDGKWDLSTKPTRNKEEKEDDGLPTRPVYTSPSKKGHYGAPGTLVGTNKITYVNHGEGIDGVETKRKIRLAHEAKIGERKPFSQMVGTKDRSNDVYAADDACLPIKPDPFEGKSRKQVMYDDKLTDKKSFVPGNPPKKGLAGYFGIASPDGGYTKFPLHVAEDLDAATINGANEREEAIPEKLRDRPSFKPSSTPKKYAIASVVKKGIYSAKLGKK
jgi:hypothetical protein